MSQRFRALRVALLAVLLAVVTAALVGRPRLEEKVRARITAEAAARGLVAHVDAVWVGIWPPVTLRGVRVEKPGAWLAVTDAADVTVGPWGRGMRLGLGALTLTGPAAFRMETVPTRWDVETVSPGGVRGELREPFEGLDVAWIPATGGGRLEGTARDLPLGRVLTLRRDGVPLLEAGVVSGTFRLATAQEVVRFEVDVTGRDVRVAALESLPGHRDEQGLSSHRDELGEASPGESPAFGEPTDLALRLNGAWHPAQGDLELRRWHLTVDGAALSGSLALVDAHRDPSLDLSLEVERIDFARLFRTSGLARMETVAARGDAGGLGSASLSARFRGRLSDPATFTVSQRLDFAPPAHAPAAIERLRRDFVHEVTLPGGGQAALEVSPASPDFIPLADVPPLFVRTLLLAEDAGFFGHHGLDLGELPSAVLTNWARGQAARGASTITQQLAKNLFLSRDKRMGRKLQELSLALLLETTLGKERILEIYLNVIEWGPGLHGLRPAARRYFHKEPAELTPRQMAFLVALIPGPIKYQRSFARGTLSPGFRPLVDDLLAKLQSVDALTVEDYQAAMAEELIVDTGEVFSAGR